MRSVSFQTHFCITSSICTTCLFNSSFYIVFWHVYCFCILHNLPKSGVCFWIWTTFFNCNRNIFSYSGKSLGHSRPTLHFSCFSKFKRSSHILLFNHLVLILLRMLFEESLRFQPVSFSFSLSFVFLKVFFF